MERRHTTDAITVQELTLYPESLDPPASNLFYGASPRLKIALLCGRRAGSTTPPPYHKNEANVCSSRTSISCQAHVSLALYTLLALLLPGNGMRG